MTTLRSAVHAYLALRRSLGFHLHDAGRLLRQFVAFMEEHEASTLTTRFALAWAQQPQTVQPAEWARRLSIVRIGRALPPRHRSPHRDPAGRPAAVSPEAGATLPVFRGRDW